MRNVGHFSGLIEPDFLGIDAREIADFGGARAQRCQGNFNHSRLNIIHDDIPTAASENRSRCDAVVKIAGVERALIGGIRQMIPVDRSGNAVTIVLDG